MSRLTTLFNNQRLHSRYGRKTPRGNHKMYYTHPVGTTYLRKVVYQTLTKGRNPHHIK